MAKKETKEEVREIKVSRVEWDDDDKAAIRALGLDPERLDALIDQYAPPMINMAITEEENGTAIDQSAAKWAAMLKDEDTVTAKEAVFIMFVVMENISRFSLALRLESLMNRAAAAAAGAVCVEISQTGWTATHYPIFSIGRVVSRTRKAINALF